jgi:hypothetical protein
MRNQIRALRYNLDGTRAWGPLTDQDLSPIHDLDNYDSDQHDCPLPCDDLSNIHSWIPYHSLDRFKRCQESLLLQISSTNFLDDTYFPVLIRTCSLESRPSNIVSNIVPVENPKRSKIFFQSSLTTAQACSSNGTKVQDKVQLSVSKNFKGNQKDVNSLFNGMQNYFSSKDNCDESFLFGYYKRTVAGIFVGGIDLR